MRKWSKKHKNYIQLQVTVKGLGGQGTQGSCSLHSFLTNLFLPHLHDSLKSEWPVRREAYTHPLLPPHTLASSSVTRFGPNVRPIRTCEVRGHRRITVLTLTLSGNERAAFSKLQAKPGITGHNPFPPPVHESALLLLITQELAAELVEGGDGSVFSLAPHPPPSQVNHFLRTCPRGQLSSFLFFLSP